MDIRSLTAGLVNRDGIWYAEEKEAISYPDDGNESCYQVENNSFWFKHRNNCITTLIRRFSPNSLFFDIGGGNGFVSKAVEDMGTETVLIEPGEKGCINARKRGLKNIVCATSENAGFAKNSMPSIGVFDVVEHMENDISFLTDMKECLMKGGYLYVTVPAYKFLWSYEDDYAGHFNRYTIASLSEKLRKTGFEVVYSTYIFSILPLPIFLMRTLPGKLRSGKNDAQHITMVSGEHEKESPMTNKIWAWELNRIKSEKSIPFGSSCLIVARKL